MQTNEIAHTCKRGRKSMHSSRAKARKYEAIEDDRKNVTRDLPTIVCAIIATTRGAEHKRDAFALAKCLAEREGRAPCGETIRRATR